MTRNQLLKIGCEVRFIYTEVGICLPTCLITASLCLLLPPSFAKLLIGKASFPSTACTEMQGEEKKGHRLPGNYVFHPTWNLTQSIRFSGLESEVA